MDAHWIESYLSEEMTPAEEASFERALLEEPGLAELFNSQWRFHRALEVLYAPDEDRKVCESVMEVIGCAETKDFIGSVMADIKHHATEKVGWLDFFSIRGSLFAAMAVLIVLGLFLFSGVFSSRDKDGVSIVSGNGVARVNGTVGSQRVGAGESLAVPEGEKVALRYADGSTVELLSGELFLPPSDGKKIKLLSGQIAASVEPQKKPFLVESPRWTVSVKGTRFTMKSSEKNDLLFVGQGRVEVCGNGTEKGEVVSVADGEAVEWRGGIKHLGKIQEGDLDLLQGEVLVEEEFGDGVETRWENAQALADGANEKGVVGSKPCQQGKHEIKRFFKGNGFVSYDAKAVFHLKIKIEKPANVGVLLADGGYLHCNRSLRQAGQWVTLSIPFFGICDARFGCQARDGGERPRFGGEKVKVCQSGDLVRSFVSSGASLGFFREKTVVANEYDHQKRRK